MRVFHIVTHFDVGGAERVAINIAKSKNPEMEYHIVEVIRSRTSFSHVFIRELQDAGIQYHRAHIPEIKFHYLFERIASLVFPLWFIFVFRKYRPNVIHCHTEIPELATFCFFKLFPKLLKQCKVVRTIHNTKLWNGMEWFGPKVERFLQEQNANIAISVAVLDNYQSLYGEKPPVIYNGMNIPKCERKYERLRDGYTNILFAGRFEEQKGIVHLIRIIQCINNDDRYFFHVIGDGQLKEQLIKGLVDCHYVEIQPALYGLDEYLSSFDYVIMPSEHEGLGLLAVEASFSYTPVIINNCSGLNETLPSDWPLKVENNDINSYMNIFQNVLPMLNRKQLGEYAFQFAKQHFAIEKMQAGYEMLYEETISFKLMGKKIFN